MTQVTNTAASAAVAVFGTCQSHIPPSLLRVIPGAMACVYTLGTAVALRIVWLIIDLLVLLQAGVRTWAGDFLHLPNYYGPVDAICMNAVFGNFHSTREALLRASMLLVPGGHLVISHLMGRSATTGHDSNNSPAAVCIATSLTCYCCTGTHHGGSR